MTTSTSNCQRRAERALVVADLLRAAIEDRAATGDVLPSEGELTRDFSVSRNTIREALGLLRSQAMVLRRPNLGTVVVGARAGHDVLQLHGLTDALAGGDASRIANAVLVAEQRPAPPPVAARLRVEVGEPVVFIERLRLLDGRPLSLEASWLPSWAAGILDHDLAGNDIFALLGRELGVTLAAASIGAEALVADDVSAQYLELPIGVAVLLVTRTASDERSVPVATEFIRYRGDRVTVDVSVPPAASGHAASEDAASGRAAR